MVNFLGMSEATDRVPSASMLRVRAPLQFAPLLIRRLLDLPSRPAVPEAQVCPTCVAFQKAAELSNGKRGAQRASRWEFVLVAAFALHLLSVVCDLSPARLTLPSQHPMTMPSQKHPMTMPSETRHYYAVITMPSQRVMTLPRRDFDVVTLTS